MDTNKSKFITKKRMIGDSSGMRFLIKIKIWGDVAIDATS